MSKTRSNWIDRKLLPLANKISKQRHLKAIQAGFMATMPLMVLGSFALILAEPPIDFNTMNSGFLRSVIEGWHGIANAWGPILWPIFSHTLGAISFFVAMATAFALAKSYKMNQVVSTIVAMVGFLLLNAVDTAGEFSLSFFEGTGLFAALFVAITTVELLRIISNIKWLKITMPEGVPPILAASFESMFPSFIVIIVYAVASYFFVNILKVPFPQFVLDLIRPVIMFIDNVFGAAIISVLTQVLWWFGVHDTAIGAIISPVRNANFAANSAAYAAGTLPSNLPHVFTSPYWWVFVTIGGSGATLALAFILFRSRSARLKQVAKVGIIPAFFNINEPLLFGIPLILNPLFLIPFIGAQTLNAIITYLAMQFNLVNKAFVEPGWNMFAPIGAFLATMDWRAVVLILGLIVLDGLIYYPFVRAYDKQLVLEEQQASGDEI